MTYDFNEMHETIKHIVDTLIEECEFDRYLTGEQQWFEWADEHLWKEHSFPCWIGINGGATRFCIWDRENPEYIYKSNKCINGDVDYCKQEYDVYLTAKEHDLEKYFAWIAPAYEIKGHCFYAMEFCNVDGDAIEERISDTITHEICNACDYDIKDLTSAQCAELDEALECNYDIHDENAVFDYLAVSYWGYDETNQVRDFLDDIGIHDCHPGNWGWTQENNLVLIDYAGYCVKARVGRCA